MKWYFGLVLFLLNWQNVWSQNNKKSQWVDSVFQTLGRDDKIGQLFVVNVSSYDPKDKIHELLDRVKENKIGGLIIGHSGPVGYAKLINVLQQLSRIPLLVSVDVSDGLSQTFDSTLVFYNPSVLNAVGNDSLLTRLNEERTRQKILLHVDHPFSFDEDLPAGVKSVDVGQIKTDPKAKKGAEENLAFLQGNDFLIEPKNTDAAIKVIAKAIRKNKSLKGQLDQSVKKILALKYEAGLATEKRISFDNLYNRLHTATGRLLKQKLAEGAITVVRNESAVLPIKKLDSLNFVSVSVGADSSNVFTHFLSKYVGFQHTSITSEEEAVNLFERLKHKDVVVVGLFDHPEWLKNFISKIDRLSGSQKVIVCDFGNPADLTAFKNADALVASYAKDPEILKATAEVIFGGIGAQGKLPITISASFPVGTKTVTKPLGRFAYALPEDVGMDSFVLEKIEPIANESIAIGATPGCHVLVAKDGKVIYEKSFGWLTYEKKIPVTDETLYDLASVTKVSATLQGVMYLQEKGLIDLNKKASVYLPELRGSNKEDFIIKDIITHQAGLWPYLPFWVETVKDSSVLKKYYHRAASAEYPFPVAESLFAAKSIKDSLWHWIIKSKVREKPAHAVFDYRYSDMGFYMMQHLNEKLLRMPQEEFLQSKIYGPLGATSTGYLPLRRFPKNRIAPTEKDTLFRKSLLVGYVHDQGAAMHGGIAGHAGLFSDANDLAKLGQMWLNKGTYGGLEFYKPETLDLFTAKQYEDSRRGLGWDKPILNDPNGPTSMYASAKTFGHTGFTGTCIWVDPEFKLVYIFLSNRVNPDMNNTKLLTANIRPRIQDVIYQSIFEYCKNRPELETK